MHRFGLLLLLLLFADSAQAAITGRVWTEEGLPLAGARVRAYERETEETWRTRALSPSPERTPLITARTADDGSFSIDAKRAAVDLLVDTPGRQTAFAEVAEGEVTSFVLAPATPKRIRILSGGRPVAGARVITARTLVAQTDQEGFYDLADGGAGLPFVIIHPDYAIAHDVALRRGVALRGRVTAGEGSAPVPDAVVRLDGWPLARTDKEGNFNIPHANERWQTLSVVHGNLAGNASRTRGDAYKIVLRPTVPFTGTVSVAEQKTRVPEARVFLHPENGAGSIASAIADAKGAFTLNGVLPGRYRIRASMPGYGGSMIATHAAAGSRVHHDVLVDPLPRVSGVVIDEEKKPVAGVTVQAQFSQSATVTGGDGRFSATSGITGRPVHLIARKRGFAPAVAGPFSLGYGRSRTGLTVTLARGFTFQLKAVGAGGIALPGEPVTISIGEDGPQGQARVVLCGEQERAIQPCRTDEQGVFATQLTEGKYEIAAGGESAVEKRLAPQILSKGNASLTIELEKAVEVSGRVTYGDGSPIDIANVAVTAKELGFPMSGRHHRVNPDGTFTLPDVAGGRVTVYAYIIDSPPTEGASVEVTAPAKNVALTIPRPMKIEGRVVDKDTRQPLSDFSVSVRRFRGSGSSVQSYTFSSEEGRFVIEGIGAGAIELTAAADGYAPATVSSAAVKEDELITIPLDRGGTIVGRVTAEGRPVSEASVMLGAPMRGPMMARNQTTTDAQGEFRFNVAAGDYNVMVNKRGFATGRKSVEVAQADESRVEIELQRGHDVRGRVVDAEGRPVPGARVASRGRSGPPPVQSDADGNFELTGLAEGTHTIAAEKNGYIPGVAENVNAASAQNITLTLNQGGTITGRVIGLSERELAAVRVNAYSRGVAPSTRPDGSGNFTLAGVPDGKIRVQAVIVGSSMRQSAPKEVDVVNGMAAPVEIDFGGAFKVSGRVTRKGAPLALAAVAFQPVQGGSGFFARDEASAGGDYEVMLSAAGEYRVTVEFGPGGRYDAGKVNISGPMVHDIDLRGGALNGRVFDAQTRVPIAGAAVQINRMGGGYPGPPVITDSDGRFIIDPATAGKYNIRVTKQRYATSHKELEVREGVPADIEIALDAGDRVAVRVIDRHTGRALDDVSLTVQDAAKKTVQSGPAMREDDGSWRLWVAPGQYTLRVWAQRYAPATVSFSVPGPEVVVAMAPGGRLVLQNIPAEASRARLRNSQGRIETTVGAPPGIFENVAPGSYQVEVVALDGKVLASRPVVIEAGQTAVVRVE